MKGRKGTHRCGDIVNARCVMCGNEFEYRFHNMEKRFCCKKCQSKWYTHYGSKTAILRNSKQKKTGYVDYGKIQTEKYINDTKITRKWWYDENGNIVRAN
jgi:hypothetical protein